MKDVITTTGTTATSNAVAYNVASIEDLQKILNSRVMCTEEGVNYTLQVSSVSSLQVPETGSPYHILNLNALTPYHMNEVGSLVEQGELTEASNVRVSARVRLGKEYIPAKGEKVRVAFTWGKTKSGEEALFVDTITALPQAETKKFDLASFMKSRG